VKAQVVLENNLSGRRAEAADEDGSGSLMGKKKMQT